MPWHEWLLIAVLFIIVAIEVAWLWMCKDL